jgi:two-component system chemotaxis sensor kinase CheA
LSVVDRLEEFPRDALEHTAGRHVVQYRNTILPLVDIGASLGYASSATDADTVQVVVYSQGGRMVGLVVDRIVDIVEEAVTVHQPSDRSGIVGPIVVQGAVTDLLDVARIIEPVVPWFEHPVAQEVLGNA